MEQSKDTVDPRSGFNSVTKTFQSLRPPLDLPPKNLPLSAAGFAFSLLHNLPCPDSLALIDSATGHRLFYSEFTRSTDTLAANLQTQIGLSKGDIAFVLSSNSVKIPILYFALLTLGVVISPANPVSTESEIARLVKLSKPVVAFVTSATAQKLQNHRLRIILIDSPEFDSLTRSSTRGVDSAEVNQSDLAAIMYSSGTTGKVKGVMLTHRNLIAIVAGYDAQARRVEKKAPGVVLYTMPFFHIFGLFYCVKSVALGETVVVMERFELRKMLRAIEEFGVNFVALAPPIVVALGKSSNNNLMAAYNLSSLQTVGCGGSALRKNAIAAFKARFSNVELIQVISIIQKSAIIYGIG